MNWFKHYNTCASDVKWLMISQTTGQKPSLVYAMWCLLMEIASNNDDWGSISNFQPSGYDILWKEEPGTCSKILDAFKEIGLVVGNRLANWDRRQTTDNNAERQKRWRERQKAAKQLATNVAGEKPSEQVGVKGDNAGVTDRNVTERYVTCRNVIITPKMRGEEILKDIKDIKNSTSSLSPQSGDQQLQKSCNPANNAPSENPTTPSEAPVSMELSPQSSKTPDCPYQELVGTYHARLPEHRRVREITDKRKRAMKSLWAGIGNRLKDNDKPDGKVERLDVFGRYLDLVARSDFLTGKVTCKDGKVFMADFDFVIRQQSFVNTIEGKYKNR